MTTAVIVVGTLVVAGGLCALWVTLWAGGDNRSGGPRSRRGEPAVHQEPAVAWDATSIAEIAGQAARTDAAIKATGIMACRGPRGTPAAELERLKTMEQLVNGIRENEAELLENHRHQSQVRTASGPTSSGPTLGQSQQRP